MTRDPVSINKRSISLIAVLVSAFLSSCAGTSGSVTVGGDFAHFDHYHGDGYPHHSHSGHYSTYRHDHVHRGYSHYGHSHPSGHPYHDHRSSSTSTQTRVNVNAPDKPSGPKVNTKTNINTKVKSRADSVLDIGL